MNCLECGKEIAQTTGKRARIFCNSTCRSNYWQKKKRESKKYDSPKLTKIFNDEPAQWKEPILPPYDMYKEGIKKAGSVSKIEQIVGLSERDPTLANWQKEQIKKLGIEISRTLDF